MATASILSTPEEAVIWVLEAHLHENSHFERIDHPIFLEPDGAARKARLAGWFKAVAPDVEVGVCPDADSGTGITFPGMDVRLVQKGMPIPAEGLVVNAESPRLDDHAVGGIFAPGDVAAALATCETYRAPRRDALPRRVHPGHQQRQRVGAPPPRWGASAGRPRTAASAPTTSGSATTSAGGVPPPPPHRPLIRPTGPHALNRRRDIPPLRLPPPAWVVVRPTRGAYWKEWSIRRKLGVASP